VAPDPFRWGDFGLGAAAALASMLLLVGMGAGAVALRRHDARVRSATA
jgi:hypothetical protein